MIKKPIRIQKTKTIRFKNKKRYHIGEEKAVINISNDKGDTIFLDEEGNLRYSGEIVLRKSDIKIGTEWMEQPINPVWGYGSANDIYVDSRSAANTAISVANVGDINSITVDNNAYLIGSDADCCQSITAVQAYCGFDNVGKLCAADNCCNSVG